ncbi:MAG: hypothetical protein ACFFD4_16590 [Candidatus Odinarchaeota archaeon]
MMVSSVQKNSCKRPKSCADAALKDTGRTGPDLTTVNLRVPFPAPVLAFLEEEARKDSEDVKIWHVVTVLNAIKGRYEDLHRNSPDREMVEKYGHLLHLLTEQGKLLLGRNPLLELATRQQENHHGVPLQERGCQNAGTVMVELAVPLPVPVLEELEQQAREEGYDFEFDLVISLLHDWKGIFSLDIPSDDSNDRYRELYTLLDEFVFNLMREEIQKRGDLDAGNQTGKKC